MKHLKKILDEIKKYFSTLGQTLRLKGELIKLKNDLIKAEIDYYKELSNNVHKIVEQNNEIIKLYGDIKSNLIKETVTYELQKRTKRG
jgi:hypothetical protein